MVDRYALSVSRALTVGFHTSGGFIANTILVLHLTVCQRSTYPFYIFSYYIKWVTTSWAYSITNAVDSSGQNMRLFVNLGYVKSVRVCLCFAKNL